MIKKFYTMKDYEMQEILLHRKWNSFSRGMASLPFLKNIFGTKSRKRITETIKESCSAPSWIWENRLGGSSKSCWDGLKGREKMRRIKKLEFQRTNL
jgi:hypothetical protein